MMVTPFASGWPASGVIQSLLAAASIVAVALILWSSRHRLAALPGLLILLGFALLITATWLFLAHFQGFGIISKWPGGANTPPLSLLWVLLLYPLLAVWFLYMDKANRSGKKNSS